MRNIPTDLLRTFVTIIELNGFRRAGDKLGRTQPAISLQMKRLQELLGVSLFLRNGSLDLTEQGAIVARHARQILAMNDDMQHELAQHKSAGTLKLGIPNDYADHFLPRLIAQLGQEAPQLTFNVVCQVSHQLISGLQRDEFDMIIAVTPKGASAGAHMVWPEPLTWVGSLDAPPMQGRPARIVCYPEGCLYRKSMIAALGPERGYEIVYESPSLAGLHAAVSTGFGITALSRRIVPKSLRAIPEDAGLPPLPDAEVALYLNSRHGRSPAVLRLAKAFSSLFEDLGQGPPAAP